MKRSFSVPLDKKKWKYVSVTLIAAATILAEGFTIPYAFGQTTIPDVPQMFQQLLELAGSIKADTGSIKARTDNLPDDPASTTDITEAQNAIEAAITGRTETTSTHLVVAGQDIPVGTPHIVVLRNTATNVFYNAAVGQEADLDGDGMLDNCEGRMIITLERDGDFDFNDNVEQFLEVTDGSLRTLSGFSNSTYGLAAYTQDIGASDSCAITITATAGDNVRPLPQ
jgi:methionine synthase II (cobalamin-independent)